MKVLQLIILCLTGKVTFGFGNGAPAQACTYIAPGHFMTGEHGLPISRRDLRETLFEVNAEIVGSYVRLSVSPTRSVTVAGFVIQARETENASPIGKFELQSQSNDSIAQYMNCNSEVIIININASFLSRILSLYIYIYIYIQKGATIIYMY